jgi:hypothetical protein
MDAQRGPEAPTDLLVAVDPRTSRHGRSRRRTTSSSRAGRRPAVLLSAVLAGGVAAAFFSIQAAPDASAEATSVLEAQQALLAEDDSLEAMPQAAITVAEAQARLQEVAASRAARAEAEAAAIEAARPKFAMPIDGARFTSCFCARWGTFH